MKLKIIMLLMVGITAFTSCDDEYEQVADFSNSQNIYVELSSKAALEVKEGVNTNVAVRLKEAIQQPVVVTYEITGAGARTGTVTIPRGVFSANIVLNYPVGTIPPAATSATSTLTLKGAMAGDKSLTIGYAGTNQVSRTITIVRP